MSDFQCLKCLRQITDSDLAMMAKEDFHKLFVAPAKSPRPIEAKPAGTVPGVAPMPPVEPDAIASGPYGEPALPKPDPSLMDTTGRRMRKFRCAVYVQHRYSNAPEFDRVLISVKILPHWWSRPGNPAVVMTVHVYDIGHATQLILDLFKSLVTMRQVGETDGAFEKPPGPRPIPVGKHDERKGIDEEVK